MKILHITAQKPHSTGSGVYMTELIHSFSNLGIEQKVVAGVSPEDSVYFPESVQMKDHPVSGSSSQYSAFRFLTQFPFCRLKGMGYSVSAYALPPCVFLKSILPCPAFYAVVVLVSCDILSTYCCSLSENPDVRNPFW